MNFKLSVFINAFRIQYMENKEIVRTPKYKFYSALMFLCIYLIIVALPYNKFLNDDWSNLIITIGKLVLSTVMLLMFKREGFTFEHVDLKRIVLFVPLLLLCGSNLIFLGINKADIATSPDYSTLINSACFCLATALSEEIIFRGMACEVIKSKYNKPLTLLISAAVFGVVHFIAGVFSSPLGALIQMGYTFYLGLVVGLTYLYGGSIYASVFIHFVFNFLNDSLFQILYEGNWNTTFYIVNISVGVVVAVYGLLLFFLFEKKNRQD